MQERRKQLGPVMAFNIKREISIGGLITIGMIFLGIAGWYFDTKAMRADVDNLKVKYDVQRENWHLLDIRLARIEERMSIETNIPFKSPPLGIQND